jgi:hypothetical protein
LAASATWPRQPVEKPRQPDSLRAIEVALWPSACRRAAQRRMSAWVDARPVVMAGQARQVGQVARIGGDGVRGELALGGQLAR